MSDFLKLFFLRGLFYFVFFILLFPLFSYSYTCTESLEIFETYSKVEQLKNHSKSKSEFEMRFIENWNRSKNRDIYEYFAFIDILTKTSYFKNLFLKWGSIPKVELKNSKLVFSLPLFDRVEVTNSESQISRKHDKIFINSNFASNRQEFFQTALRLSYFFHALEVKRAESQIKEQSFSSYKPLLFLQKTLSNPSPLLFAKNSLSHLKESTESLVQFQTKLIESSGLLLSSHSIPLNHKSTTSSLSKLLILETAWRTLTPLIFVSRYRANKKVSYNEDFLIDIGLSKKQDSPMYIRYLTEGSIRLTQNASLRALFAILAYAIGAQVFDYISAEWDVQELEDNLEETYEEPYSEKLIEIELRSQNALSNALNSVHSELKTEAIKESQLAGQRGNEIKALPSLNSKEWNID